MLTGDPERRRGLRRRAGRGLLRHRSTTRLQRTVEPTTTERILAGATSRPCCTACRLPRRPLLAIPTLQELERGTHRSGLDPEHLPAALVAVPHRLCAPALPPWSRSSGQCGVGVAGLHLAGRGSAPSAGTPSICRRRCCSATASSRSRSALAAAVVVRRLVPTLALLAVGFIGTRIVTTFVLRERYRDADRGNDCRRDRHRPVHRVRGSLDHRRNLADRNGERLSWERGQPALCTATEDANTEAAYQQCLTDNGLHYFRAYHPTDRFDQFQTDRNRALLGLAAGLFAFAYWWLTRRPA